MTARQMGPECFLNSLSLFPTWCSGLCVIKTALAWNCICPEVHKAQCPNLYSSMCELLSLRGGLFCQIQDK